jgi:hypothetical protein
MKASRSSETRPQENDKSNPRLILIKFAHTVVWAFFVACIVAIPLAGMERRFDWALVLSILVLLECIVIVANRGRCPLTDVAARYTDDGADNFDIYLPIWIARHNKTIFGFLFLAGELFVVGCWWFKR